MHDRAKFFVMPTMRAISVPNGMFRVQEFRAKGTPEDSGWDYTSPPIPRAEAISKLQRMAAAAGVPKDKLGVIYA